MGFFNKLFGGGSKSPKIEIAFPEGKLALGKHCKVQLTITAGSAPLTLTGIRADMFQFVLEKEQNKWEHALCSKEIRDHSKTLQPGEVMKADFALESKESWIATNEACYYKVWVEGMGEGLKDFVASAKIEAVKSEQAEEEEDDEFGPKQRGISIDDYLQRFREKVEELKANPDIEIIRWNYFPGLSDEQISAAAKKYEVPVEEPQRTFFRQTNGLQLLWVHKKSAYYNAVRPASSNEPLPWNYLRGKARFYDGAVMILPLEEQLRSEAVSLNTPWPEGKTINFRGKEIPARDFLSWIRIVDAYHESEDTNYVATKSGDPVIVMSGANHTEWYKYHLNFYDAYLELVLASKGIPEGRWKQMRGRDAFKRNDYRYFFKNKSDIFEISADNIALQHFFPKAIEMRLFIPVDENCQAFQAAKENALTQEELDTILSQHDLWRVSGGKAESWEVLSIVRGQMRTCSSSGPQGERGEQGFISHKRWDKVNAQAMDASHMGLIDTYAPGINFSGSDFSHCCITDSMLEGAQFNDAVLQHTDFSRSILRKASFRNADLAYADFEDTDLRGADFSGAKNLHLAKFPGASLKGVKHGLPVGA